MHEKLYPESQDKDYQNSIYKKKEYYINRIKKRSSKSKLEVLENVCNPLQRSLLPHQVFLSQFMNPETPYERLLIFHGTGTGKTCAAIRIAEQFKEQVIKYNTKMM